MFIHDGFITSHSAQKFWSIPGEDVMQFAPKNPRYHISTQKPGTWGSIVYPTYFSEGRLALEKAKEGVLDKMTEVFKAFEALTGRLYQHIETFNLDGGAKTVFLTMGSMCGNILTWLQKSGRKDVGLINLRTWRPFPKDDLRKIIEEKGIEKIIVLEKDDDLSNTIPPVGKSVASALFGIPVILRSFICGLGGRDVTKNEIEYAAQKMESVNSMNGKLYDYLGVRESKDTLHEVQF